MTAHLADPVRQCLHRRQGKSPTDTYWQCLDCGVWPVEMVTQSDGSGCGS